MRIRTVSFAVRLLATLSPALMANADDSARPDAKDIEFFEAKVRPVLVAYCLECHGATKQKGGLRLDSSSAMAKGGDLGPVVIPGDPAGSPLIEAIGHEGDVRMPPKGKIKGEEIKALTEWVRRGAVWPSETAPKETATAPPSRDFWAFKPVADPLPPTVRDEVRIRSPLDRFIFARLEAEGLRPAEPADRRTLVRRVTFDLTGLPPTPEEVKAFLADDAADAFDKVVDRLLASPAYGERWARHWLDVARYAEDQAHSFQPRLYPEGWRYRDWLVKALNEDMPYDRFLTEQIAADLIEGPNPRERKAALGFFALGPVYYGDAKKFDQYDDRIDTLTRGVLGLTVACARCHDHKYDPISQQDYYGLAGIIAGSEYVEAPLAPPEVVEAFENAKAAFEAKQKQTDAALAAEQLRLKQGRMKEVATYLVSAWMARGTTDLKQLAVREAVDVERLRRWINFLKGSKDRPILRPWYALLDREGDVCPDEVAILASELQDRVIALNEQRAGSKLEGPEKAFLDALFANGGPLDSTRDKKNAEEDFSPEARENLKALRAETKRLEKEVPHKYPIVHSLKEGKATTLKVLARGNPDNVGDDAPRRFLEVLGGSSCESGSGRLDLARAIADPGNPLTARVMVNRVWHHHFGRGLVSTPGNFGRLGERPSHPELLDWLASRFVESGWSLKALHRLILLSSTYQQVSHADDLAIERDPENRLLGRSSRRRLEVESWRDALLAVSGRLDSIVGGPSFSLEDPKATRRTLYANISRHNLAPLLRLFDFPDPNITGPARSQTTVPLQQLIVLNDELFVASAKALAVSLESVGDDVAQIRTVYERLFARPATTEEIAIGLRYLQGDDNNGLTRRQRYAQALLATNEFLYID